MGGAPRPLRYDFPWWAVPTQVIALIIVHGLVPKWIAGLGPRHGWFTGQPTAWNLLGLLPLMAGAAFLAWTVVVHDRTAPKHGWRMEPTPFEPTQYLLQRGPYGYTRNPIYVSYFFIWGGLAIF